MKTLLAAIPIPGMRTACTLLMATATLAAAAGTLGAPADPTLRPQLDRIAQRRIFFGHQSVGENLLQGMERLARTAGATLHVVPLRPDSTGGPGTIEHVFLAENGKPLAKLQAFDRALASQSKPPDIALMKFCFLDVTADTDAKALFARYRATVDGLRQRMPGTTFVHVTTPLTTIQGGAKGFMKRLLGRAPYGAVENQRREEYNQLLRQAYAGREPLFDLARVESTGPDGAAVITEWKGRYSPALAAAYTDDGSHLNDAGKLRAARELVSVLAAVPDKSTH